jgi:hypothetical protein
VIDVDLSGAIGVLVMVIWLFVIVLVVGLLAFAGRRRALRRGTYPLHLLPWYLGGPPKIDAGQPDDKRSARDRSRHP